MEARSIVGLASVTLSPKAVIPLVPTPFTSLTVQPVEVLGLLA
jgi:hypothetical protein